MLSYPMMKNLLIGGSGFIGSALGAALLAQQEKVVSVSLSREGNAKGVGSVICNLYTQPFPAELAKNASRIFILLGQVHKGFDPDQELNLIRELSRSLADSKAKIYYFSTALVYGDTKIEADESSQCSPIDHYSKFKLQSEAILRKYIPNDNLTTFRLSNVYGSPRNRGLIGILMNKLADSHPQIELNGNGQQQRDFIFLDDLVGAIQTIINHPKHVEIINISSGKSYSLIEVVGLLSEISGKKVEYTVTNIAVNEPQNNLINNHRLTSDFGFTHFTDLRDGLKRTLQRYE